MATGTIEILKHFATALAAGESLRDGSQNALERISDGLPGSRIAFIARASQDRGVADIVASHGLHAADFRRLESRLPTSSLWRILHVATPFVIDDLSQDPMLNFIGFASGSEKLAAVPLIAGARAVGLLAIAFSRGVQVDERRTIQLLETAAAMIAHTMRVDQTVGVENQRLAEENRRLTRELKDRYDFGNLVGNSGGMRQALDQVRQIARSNSAVLLRGEPGTGKDLFASAIRYNSLRSKRPFLKVDLGVMPPANIITELFGPTGHLRAVEGGTIFIDEISSAPAKAQQRLSDLLKDVRGATRDKPGEFNVRIIAATSRDLEVLTQEGKFSRQLYDELSSFTIYLPPLRERKSDILLLADHFLEKFAADQKKSILRISTPAIDMLTAYHFPGNVRELENVIEHAVTVCDSNVIHGHHLPPTLQTAEVTGTETRVTLDSAIATFERDLIQDALKSTRGNVASAARMLDSTERILGYKIKKYDLHPRRFKKWK
jgi:Nif-specific regulatory protein